MLIFEGDAQFTRNEVRTDDSEEQGKGGASSNTGSRNILFKSVFILGNNNVDVSGGSRRILSHKYRSASALSASFDCRIRTCRGPIT